MKSREWLAVVLVTVTVVVLTLLIAFWWLSSRAGQYQASAIDQAHVANGLAQAQQVRIYLMEHYASTGQWPITLEQAHFPADWLEGIEVELSEPYRLDVTPLPGDYQGGARGAQVALTYNPNSDRWSCGAGDPPMPRQMLPLNCRGAEPPSVPGVSKTVYWGTVLTLLGLIGIVLLGLNHPQVMPVLRNPAELRQLPLDRLGPVNRILGWTFRLPSTLRAAQISPAQWRRVRRFADAEPTLQLELLPSYLGLRSSALDDAEPAALAIQRWDTPANFAVGLNRLYATRPIDTDQAASLASELRREVPANELIAIVAPQQTLYDALELGTLRDSHNVAVLGPADLTRLLLSARPADDFVRLVAKQVRLTRLSPYQTRGGVTRASGFFGRETELAKLVSNEDASFLIVGGRQLGKTSLLKAVQRHYEPDPFSDCRYVVLRDHQLSPALARLAGQTADASLDESVQRLRQGRTEGHQPQRLTILIDEADQFVRWEQEHGYPQLNVVRALSEEHAVRFVFAGFWDLYRSAVLDYQSPLRNFGEILSIGALAPHACRELATEPLKLLGVTYAEPASLDQLISATGGRANLVALACQHCLEQLDINQRIIEPSHLDQALHSDAVSQALAGWGRLSNDERAARLDRIIIYSAARSGSIRVADIAALFDAGAAPEAQQIRESIERLQLAFVLTGRGSQPAADTGYQFVVPLFREQIELEDTQTLLQQELLALKAGGD